MPISDLAPADLVAADTMAVTVAGALSLGLPLPELVTMHPGRWPSVSIQFSRFSSPASLADRLGFVQEWAARFGVEVSEDRGYYRARFIHAGIEFTVYTTDETVQ